MTENFNPKLPPKPASGSPETAASGSRDLHSDSHPDSHLDEQAQSWPVEAAEGLEALLAGGLPCVGSGEGPMDEFLVEAQRECPAPEEWTRLAGGEALLVEVDALLAHAAFCSDCVARLQIGLSLFAEEAAPEEAAQMANLALCSPDGQRQLAKKLAGTPIRSEGRGGRGKVAKLYLWSGAALAATLVLSVGLSFWWQTVHTPERLLAEAYTHSRNFDFRIPGAGYAEVSSSRLRGTTAAHESSQLLDAQLRIQRHLARTPEDRHWLQLAARADVLEQKYDSAIAILDHLLATEAKTPSLLVDDATAYFERGNCSGSESDRATALDELRRADELAPGDPVVLFNEAVTMEDCGQLMNAVETWNRYLRFERDARWQSEGRRRLQALEVRLNELKTHTN